MMGEQESDPRYTAFEDYGPLRALGRDRSRFNVVALVTRPGTGLFFAELEHRYFPPGTPRNSDFTLIIANWEGMTWAVGSIPAKAKRFAYRVAERFARRRDEALDYARGIMDPYKKINRVTLEFVWV